MLNDFISIDYLFTFAGMVAAVIFLTQFTKKLFDAIGNNRTKWIVYGFSVALCVFAAMWQGKFSTGREIVETCVTYLVNSVIVWFASMKAFETIKGDDGNV